MRLLQKHRRLSLRLLAQIEADGRPRCADQFAQRLGRVMAVAQFDEHGIGLDDQIARLVLFRQSEGRLGRRGLRVDRGMREILDPAAGLILKQNNAVAQAIGGNDVAHGPYRLAAGALSLESPRPDRCSAVTTNQDAQSGRYSYSTEEKREIMLIA